jgi:membrane dipeptidase
LDRRTAVRTLTAAAMAAVAAPAVLRRRYQLFAHSQTQYSARTLALVREATVVDMLCQFAFDDFSKSDTPPVTTRWRREPASFTAEHFAMFRDSGVNVLALGSGPGEYEAALRFYAEWNGFIASHSNWFSRIDQGVDFRAIKGSGKVGIMITMQNSDHFRTPNDVDTFYQLGQRVSQLTYNMQSRIGAGFLENRDGGLSNFGGDIIKRMEQTGMVVDLSHCGDQTTLDALAAATRPPIFSHASSRALLPSCMRCKTDEMLTKLAAKGGVVGIPMIRFMIRPAPPVTVEHVVDHIDHLIKTMGPNHVGIGSDMDMAGLANGVPRSGPAPVMNQPNFSRYGAYFAENGGAHVDGLNHSKRIFDVTEAMVRRKHSDDTIKLVLGGNFARVMSETWK